LWFVLGESSPRVTVDEPWPVEVGGFVSAWRVVAEDGVECEPGGHDFVVGAGVGVSGEFVCVVFQFESGGGVAVGEPDFALAEVFG
jgi:hypothetical protein